MTRSRLPTLVRLGLALGASMFQPHALPPAAPAPRPKRAPAPPDPHADTRVVVQCGCGSALRWRGPVQALCDAWTRDGAAWRCPSCNPTARHLTPIEALLAYVGGVVPEATVEPGAAGGVRLVLPSVAAARAAVRALRAAGLKAGPLEATIYVRPP